VRALARSYGDKSPTTNLLPTIFGQTLFNNRPAEQAQKKRATSGGGGRQLLYADPSEV